MKYAVYVEGKAEMLFVADVLQKYSGYDFGKVGFRCITLNNDTFLPVNYPVQGDESSANFYHVYKSFVKEQVINRGVIAEMHAAQSEQIADDTVITRLHFAIMEYESWMLALIENFVVSHGSSIETIEQQLNVDLHSDIEETVFHPFNLVQKIYRLLDESYHKHEGDQMSFLSTLQYEDYEVLRHSGRCASFGKFLDSLLDNIVRELP